MSRAPVVRTPFSPFEKSLIRALGSVRYTPGSAAKRFARDMNTILDKQPELGISQGQRRFMQKVAYAHRRQLPKALQQPTRPSIEETQFWTDFYAAYDEFSHLEPTEADLEEMREWRSAIPKPDISIADSSNPQPEIHRNQMLLL